MIMFPTNHFRIFLCAAGLQLVVAAAQATDPPIPENTFAKKKESIDWNQIGTTAGADYQAEGLSVAATEAGARLHCVFQRLDGEATAEGLWLVSTVANQPADRFRVLATAVDLQALPPQGRTTMAGQTVRFTRPGLVEEYSVSMDGVRQDFVVPQRPAGNGRLTVQLAVSGARVEPASYGAHLVLQKSGRKLAYSRLHAKDAIGKELPAYIEVQKNWGFGFRTSDCTMAVVVNDAGAVYPVRIDPTFSDANWISINPGIPGADGNVYAAVTDGLGNLYIGGAFSVVGNVMANNIAKWDGSAWSALGSGMGGNPSPYVYALAVSGTNLYAGGIFTTAEDNPANYIARWDGNNWSPVGSGVAGGLFYSVVSALAVSGTNLYAGGAFSTAGGNAASNIAQWDGSNWSALGAGIGGEVYVLAVSGGTLYAGGSFTTAGGNSATNIARWDGSSWSPLDLGINGPVSALALSGGTLYAGGNFATAGGSPAIYIAQWDGNSWSALGAGMAGGGYPPGVKALAVSGGTLYAGGWFDTADGNAASCIARWNGSSWSPLASGMTEPVFALAVSGGTLYAGGHFTTAGGNAGNYIAKWGGNSWSALGSGLGEGDNSPYYTYTPVTVLAVSEGKVYAGGQLLTAGTNPGNYIAQWNGSGWSALGSGMNGEVDALVLSGGTLYAGGQFTTAGSHPANYIARWDGSSWSPLGAGISGPVFALAVSGGTLYAGGGFTNAGGTPASCIAQWNGSSWLPLGSGLNAEVLALAVSGTNLYAGGYFTTAGGNAANYIAQWDGSNWSQLGSGMGGVDYPYVSALAVSGATLYAGGVFTTADGNAANYIAQWDGRNWSALGLGMGGNSEPYVYALAVSGGALYAGGEFTTADGIPANYIAQWDGSSWSALGSGMGGGGAGISWVSALVASDGNLYAGGYFTTAGGKVSGYVAEALLPGKPPFIITTNGNFGFTNGHSSFGFDVTGSPGDTQVVLGSTNLSTWVPLQTNVPSDALWYFSDPSATNFTQRFYRAELQQ